VGVITEAELKTGLNISSFGSTLIDDANAAAAIATLGLDADIATLSLPASTTIASAAQTFLAATTDTAQYAALAVNKNYLSGQAALLNSSKIVLVYLGASNATGRLAEAAYSYDSLTFTANSKIKVWNNSVSDTYPTSPTTPTGFTWQTADPNTISSAYSISGTAVAWCGIVGKCSDGLAHANTALEAADFIQKATGADIWLFTVHKPSSTLADFETGGELRTILDNHITTALAAAGGPGASAFANIVMWDSGGNDTGTNYASYGDSAVALKEDFEADGWCNKNESQWLVLQYAQYTNALNNYWAGQSEFADRLGAAGLFINSSDWNRISAHFSAIELRWRGIRSAMGALYGPLPGQPISREMQRMTWQNGAKSTVASSGSAVLFPFNSSATMASGDRLFQFSEAGTAKAWLDSADGLWVLGGVASSGRYSSSVTSTTGNPAIAHILGTPNAYDSPTVQFIAEFDNNGVEVAAINSEGAFCGDGTTLKLKPNYLGSATAQLNLSITTGVLDYDFLGTKGQKFTLSNRTGTTGADDYFTFETAATNTAAATKLLNLINGGSVFSVQTAGDILNNGVHTSNVASGGDGFKSSTVNTFSSGNVASWYNNTTQVGRLDYSGVLTISGAFVNTYGYYTSQQPDTNNIVAFTHEGPSFTGTGQWMVQWLSGTTALMGITQEGYICNPALSGGIGFKCNALTTHHIDLTTNSGIHIFTHYHGTTAGNGGWRFTKSGTVIGSTGNLFTVDLPTAPTAATTLLFAATVASTNKFVVNAVGLPGYFGVTPPTAQTTSGTRVGVISAGSTDAVYRNTKFGESGTGYTCGDVVACLKAHGLLAA